MRSEYYLRGLDVSGRQRWLGQQELGLLESGHMVHVSCPVEEGGYLGHLVHHVLVNLLTGHHQQQPLQVVGGNLVEDHLNVQLVVQPQWVVPHRPGVLEMFIF